MPRTQAEATRFTSTAPHAHSKSSIASTIDLAGPPPPNETPAQKVARLRDASRRAKMGQESRWDRVILRGRVVADVAHKTVTGGLILLSVVAAGFATLSFGSMAIENRRKKKEWYAVQEVNYQKALELARHAEADGTITPELKLVLNKERALEQAAAGRNAPGFWSRVRSNAFGGLRKEEQAAVTAMPGVGPENVAKQALIAREQEGMTRELAPETPIGVRGPREVQAAQDSRAVESRGVGRGGIHGGSLDRMGEEAASSLKSSSQKLFDWIAQR